MSRYFNRRYLRVASAFLATSVVFAACSIASDEYTSSVDVGTRPEQLQDDDPSPVNAGAEAESADATSEELAGFDMGSIRPGAAAAQPGDADAGADVDLEFAAGEATPAPTPTVRPSPTAAPTTAAQATAVPATATPEVDPSPTAEESADADPTATEEPTTEADPTATEEPTATETPDPTATAEPDATATPVPTDVPTATPVPTAVPTATTEPTPTVEATPTTQPSVGQTIFLANCASCHGDDGNTVVGDVEFRLTESSSPLDSIVTVVTDPEGAFGIMPAFRDVLTVEEINAVSAYVISDIQAFPLE